LTSILCEKKSHEHKTVALSTEDLFDSDDADVEDGEDRSVSRKQMTATTTKKNVAVMMMAKRKRRRKMRRKKMMMRLMVLRKTVLRQVSMTRSVTVGGVISTVRTVTETVS